MLLNKYPFNVSLILNCYQSKEETRWEYFGEHSDRIKVKENVFHFVVRIFCLVTNIKSIPFQRFSLEEVRRDCSEREWAHSSWQIQIEIKNQNIFPVWHGSLRRYRDSGWKKRTEWNILPWICIRFDYLKVKPYLYTL